MLSLSDDLVKSGSDFVDGEDAVALRDRALFLVGFAGAFRRSELVAIDVHHLRVEADCVVVHLARSKGDQAGKGADVALPRMRGAQSAASDTCPVCAPEAWLRRAKIRRVPVFRGVTAHGTLEERRPGPACATSCRAGPSSPS